VHPLMSEPFIAVTPPGKSPHDLPLIQYTARHLMGRQIAAHLAKVGYNSTYRFELDSYPAILAMVAAGEGWTILTPLALHHARAFRMEVEVHPLPFEPLERSLSLSTRSETMGDMPVLVTSRLKALIASEVIAPAIESWGWLSPALRVL
jgi:DNA-binding transcriptional LysR family regulator